MSLQPFVDYVFSEKVSMIVNDGVFVGTQDYFFCVPSKLNDYGYKETTVTTFSFKGKEIKDAVMDIIKASKSKAELEKNFLDLKEDFPEMEVFNMEDLKSFKVQAGFLGSGIHVQKEGAWGWSPFVQSLGKEKKQIREFYINHPKLK